MSRALTDADGTAKRYEAFLRQYPTGRLTVAVGFASVRGLAWLAQRTRDRPVRLLIGNCQRQRFAKASDEDRRVAAAFLDRWDVEVKNWYRKHPVSREAHLKVWMIEAEGGPVALVGSANLTGAGLFQNWEVVVEARGADRDRTVSEVRALWREAWTPDKVRKYVAGEAEPVESAKQPYAVRPDRQELEPEPANQERKRVPFGCWYLVVAVLGLVVWWLVTVVADYWRWWCETTSLC
ncbi:MAG: hypothetical protein F4Y40_04325 [Acidimicrobiia bacterium]|nr:hypothetical protein [Acidimicrobiia bacterium]